MNFPRLRRWVRGGAVIGALWLLAGCATPRVEKTYRRESRAQPEQAALIRGVPAPLHYAADGRWASAAAVLRFWKQPLRRGALAKTIREEARPLSPEDALCGVIWERGIWAVGQRSSPDRVKLQLRSRVPALLLIQEQPLGLEPPVYVLAVGYSETRDALLCWNEEGRLEERPWSELIRGWRATDYHALLVCPPEFPSWPLAAEEYASRARFYERVSDWDRAVRDYEAARKAAPVPPVLLAALGNAYRQLKQSDRAEALYREAISNDPRLARAYNNLAYLLVEERRDLAEAARLARQAIVLDPANPLYLDTLGTILLQQQDGKEAADVLERAWGRSRWHPVAVQIEIGLRLVQAHLMNGQDHLAAEVLRDVLSLDPGTPVPDDWKRLLKRKP